MNAADINARIIESQENRFRKFVDLLRQRKQTINTAERYPVFSVIEGQSKKYTFFNAATKQDKNLLIKGNNITFKTEKVAFNECFIIETLGAHENLVKVNLFFMMTIDTSTSIYIEMEKCWGNLDHYCRHYVMTKDKSQLVVHQLASALVYLKSRGVVHCDIKPFNVLLTNAFVTTDTDESGQVKLCDYDCSRVTSFCNKLCDPAIEVNPVLARPPEILLCLPFDYAVDMFALGTVAMFVVNASIGVRYEELFLPFLLQENDHVQMSHLSKILGPVPDHMFETRDNTYRNHMHLFANTPFVKKPLPLPPIGFEHHFVHISQSDDPWSREMALLIKRMTMLDPYERIKPEILAEQTRKIKQGKIKQ